MLIRMFGVFGIMLGAAYFNEGVKVIGILQFELPKKLSGMFLTWLSFLAWDFLFGVFADNRRHMLKPVP